MHAATTADDISPASYIRPPNYGSYGILLIMGNAGFRSSAVAQLETKALSRNSMRLRSLLLVEVDTNHDQGMRLPKLLDLQSLNPKPLNPKA